MARLAGLGRLAEAQEVYRASASQLRELDHHHDSIAAVSCLDAHPSLDAFGELFRQYLTCSRVLRANQDPRAAEVLSRAYHLLQEWAGKIDDVDLRRSFLESVAVNREIVREYTKIERGTDA